MELRGRRKARRKSVGKAKGGSAGRTGGEREREQAPGRDGSGSGIPHILHCAWCVRECVRARGRGSSLGLVLAASVEPVVVRLARLVASPVARPHIT